MTLCFLRFLSFLQWRKAGGRLSGGLGPHGCGSPASVLEGPACRNAVAVRLSGRCRAY